MFKVTVRDTATPALEKLVSNITTGAKSALEAGGKAGLAEAQNRAPVDTGYLKGQLYQQLSGKGVELGGKADYTIYQEFGTSRGVPARSFIRGGAEVAVKTVMQQLPKALGLS